jgi:hypothetical protein
MNVIVLLLIILLLLNFKGIEHLFRSVYYNKLKFIKLPENKNNQQVSKKNKILIISYDNRVKDYINLHKESFNDYAKKWDLTFKFFNDGFENVNIYWKKIFLLNREIKNYDYIMWVDTDTFVKNDNFDLNGYLNEYTSDIFIGKDNEILFYDDLLNFNAGVFIIKNSEIGRSFLQDLINEYETNKDYCLVNKKLNGVYGGMCYEQGIINKLLKTKYTNNITLMDRSLVSNNRNCETENNFIIHIWDKENMINCFKKVT